MSYGIRIGMWSGPRSLSTALLRAWESRDDTAVIDEPFSSYLHAVGASRTCQSIDWKPIVRKLEGPIPGDKHIWYQKHHAHLLPHIPNGFTYKLINCFLIRAPSLVIDSFSRVDPEFTAADLGYPQLAELFDDIRVRSGTIPVVLDASDLLANPRAGLQSLCDALHINFNPKMLSWRRGRRLTDPPASDRWYGKVRASTGFEKTKNQDEPELPERYRSILNECNKYYQYMHSYRLNFRRRS